MASVFDVANFFIDIAQHEEEEFMTPLRLQKLMYFAQAWSFARLRRPLFSDGIEAWPLGPVVPSVYHKYKVCGREPIVHVDEDYQYNVFQQDEVDLLLDVYLHYGKYTASALVDLTHKSKPWIEACASGRSQISSEAIRAHFASLEKQLPYYSEVVPSSLPVENGYRSASNALILPAEADNDWGDYDGN